MSTNPFEDDAIDEALKACDVLTDAWDKVVRHQVFDDCRDRPGMPEKMLNRLDNLAKAETQSAAMLAKIADLAELIAALGELVDAAAEARTDVGQ